MLAHGALCEQEDAGALDQRADDGNGWSHGVLLNRELGGAATFSGPRCSWGMKTFLKISLIVVLALLALKFLPVFLVGGIAGLLIAAVLGVVGVSLLAAMLAALVAVALGLAFALSPIWIPVLIVMGVISLFKKLGDKPAAPPVIAA